MKFAYVIAAIAVMVLASTAFGECKCGCEDTSRVRATTGSGSVDSLAAATLGSVVEALEDYKRSVHADALLSGSYDGEAAAAVASMGVNDILAYVRNDLGLTDSAPKVALTADGQMAREKIAAVLRDAKVKAVSMKSAHPDAWPMKIRPTEPAPARSPSPQFTAPAPAPTQVMMIPTYQQPVVYQRPTVVAAPAPVPFCASGRCRIR